MIEMRSFCDYGLIRLKLKSCDRSKSISKVRLDFENLAGLISVIGWGELRGEIGQAGYCR